MNRDNQASWGEPRPDILRAGILLLLLAITGLGFWFRWLYVRDVSFFVDEYLTVRAAHQILARGVPLLASGNFYSHGLLLSYIDAAVIAIGGDQAWLLRLPVLVLSTAAIPLVYELGRRIVSPVAGLIAAALLAVSPESILWGGRIRMYAPLQFFVLLTTLVFYLWVVRQDDRPAYRLLFVVSYWAALFSHAEVMLLLPIWGLWALVQRGWRWCLRLPNLSAFGLSGLSIVIEILLRRIGPPVQAWVAPGIFEPVGRQYLGAGIDWPGVQKVVAPLFLTPVHLPFTLLVLVGLGYLFLSWRRPAGLVAATEKQGVAYLYMLLLPALIVLLFGVDPSWKSPRYGLMLLPHFFLIAGALLSWLGRWLRPYIGRALAWAAVPAVVVLIVLGSWSSSVAATRESVPAYDWAFGYVAAHQQPGDVVITFLCPAAFQHLGRCDYLAIPDDYQGFAFRQEGRWVSGWDAVPMLDSASGLKAILDGAHQTWFVIDEGRFNSRYPADLTQAVWDGMELVAAQQEMLVFRSLGAEEPEVAGYQDRRAEFQDGINLVGYALDPQAVVAGREVPLVLYWQARSRVLGAYTTFVHLLDERGDLRAQVDRTPFEGLYPTTHWAPGPVLPDRNILSLPGNLEPGRYRLAVGLYDAVSLEPLPVIGGDAVLDYVWIGPRPPLPEPQVRLEATFGDTIRLLGYDLPADSSRVLSPGTTSTITLYWQTIGPVDRNYTVFVHLVDEAGQIQAQSDGPPQGGRYPTSFWEQGEMLEDTHTIALGAAVPVGRYRLLVGLYTLEDGARLAVTDGPPAGEGSLLLTWLAVR
jgi:4-amino-4-deoxy-L-arabinose transferase-like glycosyltransferase